MLIKYCSNCRADVGALPTPNGLFPETCQVCGTPNLSPRRDWRATVSRRLGTYHAEIERTEWMSENYTAALARKAIREAAGLSRFDPDKTVTVTLDQRASYKGTMMLYYTGTITPREAS